MSEGHKGSAAALEFTEQMRGYVGAGQTSYKTGYEAGKEAGSELHFELTIHIDDVERFCTQADHQGACRGYVESALVGGRRLVEKGTFNLFVDGPGDQDRKKIVYRLFFHDAGGQPMTLTGWKDVQDNVGLDLWSDTTTLGFYLLKGHVEQTAEPQADVAGAGQLRLTPWDLVKQLASFRTYAPTAASRFSALARFGRFFLGNLWDSYGPAHLCPSENEFEREIPLYTTEGVRDAQCTTHPFITGDKIGLSLLRFKRSDSKNVVMIIHGLTTSSDMFIMPEHYNLVSYLLDNKLTDVWTVDYRMSNRFPYNLMRTRYSMDDIALYDYPAALAEIRRHVGPEANIHVICHCLGAVSFMMSLFGKAVSGVKSVVANSAALSPRVPRWSWFKLTFAPFLSEYVLNLPYLNPRWSQEPGITTGKIFTKLNSFIHRECDVPACHMLSLMWGTGWPALYSHENLADITHKRGGDLYGPTSVHYYRHVRKMVNSNNTAVKFDPRNAKHAALPDNYMKYAAEIKTPVLLTTGGENHVFTDSNILCHKRLEEAAPGRHLLKVFPRYGHQDVFMGKNVDRDIFPSILEFIQAHC